LQRKALVLAALGFTFLGVVGGCGGSGSTAVSADCDSALKEVPSQDINAAESDIAAAQDATLVACKSKNEWTAGATRDHVALGGTSPEQVLAAFCGEDLSRPACQGVTPQTPTTVASDTTPTTNPPIITLAEFLQIRDGMSHDEVSAIVGDGGTTAAQNGTQITYVWNGDGPPGSNATVTFDGDAVVAKAQVGLT